MKTRRQLWALFDDDQPVGLQGVDLEAPVIPLNFAAVIPGKVSKAAANLKAIQAALDRLGLAELAPGLGVVYMAGTLILRSDSTLRIGAGTELKRTNVAGGSTAVKMGINENWNSTVFPVTGNLTAAAVGYAANVVQVTANITGGTIKAGGYVLVKNDTTGVYNGVFRVVSATATQVKWVMPMDAAGITPSAGNVTIAQADANIKLDVMGWIDGGTDEGAFAQVDGLEKMGFIFNKVGNLEVLAFHGKGIEKYHLYPSNCWRPKFGRLHFDADSAGLQFGSPCWGIEIDSITGRASDDMLAFVQNDYGYYQYAMPDGGLGEYDGVTVGSIDVDYCRTGAVAIYPAAGQVMRGFHFRRIVNRGKDGCALVVMGIDQQRGVLDDITVDYCDAQNLPVSVSWCTVNHMDLYCPPGAGGLQAKKFNYVAANVVANATTVTLPSVAGLRNGADVSATDGTGSQNIQPGTRILSIAGNVITLDRPMTNAGALVNFSMNFSVTPARKRGFVVVSNGGKFGFIKVRGQCYLDTTAAASSPAVVSFQAGTDNGANHIDVSGLKVLAVGDSSKSYSVVLQSSTSRVASVNASGLEMEGLGNLADNGGAVGTEFTVNNVVAKNIQFLFGDVGGATIVGSDIRVSGTLGAAGVFNLYGAAKTYNMSIKNIVNTTGQNLLSIGAGSTVNLLNGDGSVVVDGATITPKQGSMFFNTNAAYGTGVGFFAKGNSGAGAASRIAS